MKTVSSKYVWYLILTIFLSLNILGKDNPKIINSDGSTGFIRNDGQWDEKACYLLKSNHYDAWISGNGITFAVGKKLNIESDADPKFNRPDDAQMKIHTVNMSLSGSNLNFKGSKRKSCYFNYIFGDNPKGTVANVPSFSGLTAKNAYEGIDLSLNESGGCLQYEFTIQPGAIPGNIMLNFDGANSLSLNQAGELIMGTTLGDLIHKDLKAFQISGGKKTFIPCSFKIIGNDKVTFETGEYDYNLPLIIDPLVWSSYFGTISDEEARAITVSQSGNAIITGYTSSNAFPTTSGTYDISYNGLNEVFVSKFDTSGTSLIFSTYLGGSLNDFGFAVTCDASGNIWVSGETASSNFPTTSGGYDISFNGNYDIFLSKLNPAGSQLLYSSFIGGSSEDRANALRLDQNGNIYISGFSFSGNFPTTSGAFDQSFNGSGTPVTSDAIVCKLNGAASTMLYSTYIGGAADDYISAIAVDNSANVYFCGTTKSSDFPIGTETINTSLQGIRDAFCGKLDATGSSLTYSTYLGGFLDDYGYGLAIDTSGCAFITGTTYSNNFPVSPGAYDISKSGSDAYITKINQEGTGYVYSTFIGGSLVDYANAIIINPLGYAFITGNSNSDDFPVNEGSSSGDIFLSALSPYGTYLAYSTTIGSGYNDISSAIAIGPSNKIYICGKTYGDLNASGGYDISFNGTTDAFIAKFDPSLIIQQEIDTLTIPLLQGWNLISSNLIPYDTRLVNILSGISGSMNIMKDGSGNLYIPQYGINTIGNWNFENGYYIFMNNPADLNICGFAVNPSDYPLSLSDGWNLVSYLSNTEIPVTVALSSIQSSLLLVKDGLGNLYIPDYGVDLIGYMQPGKGYYIYVTTPATLIYP